MCVGSRKGGGVCWLGCVSGTDLSLNRLSLGTALGSTYCPIVSGSRMLCVCMRGVCARLVVVVCHGPARISQVINSLIRWLTPCNPNVSQTSRPSSQNNATVKTTKSKHGIAGHAATHAFYHCLGQVCRERGRQVAQNKVRVADLLLKASTGHAQKLMPSPDAPLHMC